MNICFPEKIDLWNAGLTGTSRHRGATSPHSFVPLQFAFAANSLGIFLSGIFCVFVHLSVTYIMCNLVQ